MASSKKEQSIQLLDSLKIEIDEIDIGNPIAWQGIEDSLQACADGFPQNLTVPLQLLSTAIKAAHELSDDSKKQSFSLIDALTNAIQAIQDYLAGAPDKKDLMDMASEALNSAMTKENKGDHKQPALQDVSGDINETSAMDSLDDATSLFIQLEPDDSDGLKSLGRLLADIKEAGSYSMTCKESINACLSKIDDMIKGATEDPNVTFFEIGELLEKSVDHANSLIEPKPSSEPHDPDTEATFDGTGDREDVIDSVLPENTINALEIDEQMKSQKQVPIKEDTLDTSDVDSQTYHMPEDADADLLAEFITEGLDLISNAEEALLTLENDPQDMDAVNMVFRAFHTIKGTAAFMDLTLIAEMGHHSESLLSRVRDGEIRYGGGYADLSLRALDMIKDLILSVQSALEKNGPLLQPSGYPELMSLLSDPEGAGISDDTDDTPVPRLGDVIVAQGKVDRETLEKAANNHPHERLGTAIVKEKAATITEVGQALRTQKRMKSGGQVVES